METQILEKKTAEQFIKEFTASDKPEIKSIRVIVEKLDNGYISDAEGKRKIYNDTKEIVKAIGINSILEGITENEYKFNIDLVPKEEYADYADALAFSKQSIAEEKLTLESAKESGLIEAADKFNPHKNKPVESDYEIKVTKANCYSAARLKGIDFKSLDEQLPLSNSEKAEIMGMNKTTLYGLWKKVESGEAKYQLASTRIVMTILAKYYEKNLNIRSCVKDQQNMLKENLLANIREIELLTSGQKFVKSSELSKKINEMRKLLIS